MNQGSRKNSFGKFGCFYRRSRSELEVNILSFLFRHSKYTCIQDDKANRYWAYLSTCNRKQRGNLIKLVCGIIYLKCSNNVVDNKHCKIYWEVRQVHRFACTVEFYRLTGGFYPSSGNRKNMNLDVFFLPNGIPVWFNCTYRQN